MLHVHVLPGFGSSIYDVCPACEFKRLVELGVPEEIAREAAEIRYVMNPDYIPPYGILALAEEFKALEEKYGQAIP